MAGCTSKTWTPEQRKAHGDKIRAACKTRNQRRTQNIPFGVMRFRSAAEIFWDILVDVYRGKPLSDWVAEEWCMNAIKDCAKRAAGIPLESGEELQEPIPYLGKQK